MIALFMIGSALCVVGLIAREAAGDHSPKLEAFARYSFFTGVICLLIWITANV